MLTLGFDTSASGFSIALLDDEKIIAQKIILESGKQSEFLIPEIEAVLKSQKIWYQNLDLIAATSGPGTFTGTRIGLTTARTLKAALGIPLILVNSCEAAAFAKRENDGEIFVALDAAMDELFFAKYFCQNQKLECLIEPCLISADELTKNLPTENFTLTKENPTADQIALLALRKFRDKNFDENHDAFYLRAPRITERKK